ncbi:hypothetical protein JTE90_023902 [Oedothorax gibbosus]|uniref:Uncharacterized protein n=1 Tax=Oedothorax gibbosus TaxID=931172 RepID=A0AAV6UMC5_9ARAC|nr:hypothetical protein JTE90_023902 [Oedothorax gibbosus]
MDESNRVPQRTRPRPYDLRRKVLLKNFLREQMTHIPLPPSSRRPDDDAIADDEVSSTVGNEENIEQPPDNIIQKIETPPLPIHVPEPVPGTSSSSTDIESPDSSTSQEPDDAEEEDDNKNPRPTFKKLSNLLRSKMKTVGGRGKGIAKTKLKMELQKPRIVNVNETRPAVKPKSKSFFAMFKSRRVFVNRKKVRSPTKVLSPAPTRTTSTQSVQTDVSFTQDAFENMEQSNRSLREENRLLSESLSSFMSDFDLKLSPLKIPYGTDSYITSAGSSQSQNTPQTPSGVPNTRINYGNTPPRIKIPRSKSMQDRFDRRFPNRRTRSMNYGLSKRFYDSSSLQPHPYRRNFNGETSTGYRHDRQRPNSFSSFDSNLNRNPALQSNSRLPPHQLPIGKNPNVTYSNRANPNSPQANANSSRAIVRRSSMPERSSYQPSRPILRHKSTRVNGYNYANGYRGEHNYNVINGNVPIRRRSSSNGDYGRPVPFQSLPPEAFY